MSFESTTRLIISLDGKWNLSIPGKPSSYKLEVPGSWQAQIDELRNHVSNATYSRNVNIPESWQNKRVFIHFGAVDYLADVSINSQKTGSHEGGYTPFEFEIQDNLKFGETNEITVNVTDAGPKRPTGDLKFEEIPHGKQMWYGNTSGLWQSVYLEARSASYIDRIVVDPDIDKSTAAFSIELVDVQQGFVRISVDSPEGAPAVQGTSLDIQDEQDKISWETSIPDAELWSPDSPSLYTVKAELIIDNQVVDSLSSNFGMRKIEVKNGQILLNNAPIFLAGALDQDFYPHTEYVIPSEEYLRDQFLKAKHLGLNLLRCHIKVPDPRYLEWADKLGLLVWYEIPNWVNLTEDAKRRAKDMLAPMLKRDHNHPSLIIVSIINEGWGWDGKNPEHRKWLGEMYDYAKSLEPNRLIVDNSACGGNFHIKTDIEDFHVYLSTPDQAQIYRDWVADFAQHPAWTFSEHGDAQRRGFEPLLLSEFGTWGLPKLSDLYECYGGKEPWWFPTGDDETRPEGVAAKGVEQRFKKWHLDKVFASLDELSLASQTHEWLALKFQIEEMRKHPSIVGYIITEFTDLQWESNGLLDWCRNPKIFHDIMHTVQDQDIIFAQPARTNCVSGEQVQLGAWISHFSQTDLTSSNLEWSVEQSPVNGIIDIEAITPGDAKCIAEIIFPAPDLSSPGKIRINLSLIDSKGTLIASNYLDLIIFPKQQPEMPQNVLIATEINADTIAQIRNGTNAIICIESTEQLPISMMGLEIVSRHVNERWGSWCTNLTWFKDSPAFDGTSLPKTMDFSFENIIPNSVIEGIDAKHWENDVLSGMFVGWLRSIAAVAIQIRCGKGKAIITTLPLLTASKSDPMAQYMLASLAQYVNSEQCAPALELKN